MLPEVSPSDLAAELAGTDPPVVIDVREPEELEISRFPSYVNIPMTQLSTRLAEFDREANLVIACHVGGRSYRVTAYMMLAGFRRVRNLAGGIDQWALDVDPTLTRY
jgi:adenylyltransferase/sulfurtransferase